MNFYYYLFSNAYWVAFSNLNEKTYPQEYALIFLSVVDLFLFVVIGGLVNLVLDRNILNGGLVVGVSILIVTLNYYLFLKNKKYDSIVSSFEKVGLPDFRRSRVKILIATYLTMSLLAISVAALNCVYLG